MRRRILTLSVGLTVLVILAFAIPLAALIDDDVRNKALDGARYQTQDLAAYISVVDTDDDHVGQYIRRVDARSGATSWVQFSDGSTIGNPPASWSDDVKLDPPPVKGQGGADSDSQGSPRQGGTGDLSVITLSDGCVTAATTSTVRGTALVATYLDDDSLHAGLGLRWSILAAASLLLLGLSVLAAEVVARRMTRPLEHVAGTAARLAAGDIDARASEDGPVEVAQVSSALNRLADRIDEVIAAERESVADMSHRLRTPLTALRLDIDAMADRAAAAELGTHVTALERALTAVIRAARRPQREGRIPQCDATAIVRDRVAFWIPLFEDQRRQVTVSADPRPRRVRLSDEDLCVAVDALMENVIAHTPEGCAVDVTLEARPGATVLRISDNGPGMPVGAGARGRSDRGSTGLGLDIARRSAEAAGGHLRVWANDPHGAVVELTFADVPAT